MSSRVTSAPGVLRRTTIVAVALAAVLLALVATPAGVEAAARQVTVLTNDDFTYGTYIIDRPGIYRLGEDIVFNPNSPETLTAAIDAEIIPADLAPLLGLTSPVDAYRAGSPLFTQFAHGPTAAFTPGGPLDARYDPAAYGIGFFAAIAISADDVILDLAGHTIQQSTEHALLQRFFAVIELADQPFVPNQGPSSFGDELDPAQRVTIKNGTIGLSSHHGIHGNGNADITVRNVDFVDFEVAAMALNGVDGLVVENSTATNRKDVPVLGTFSSAQFIKAYVEELVRHGSDTTLTVDGVELSATDVRDQLATAINNTHHDLIAEPRIVDGRAQIDPVAHPTEYAVFHNPSGLLDGNSYSYLVNNLGVAVNGFPSRPDGVDRIPSQNVTFRNVTVLDQQATINEVVAINSGGKPAIDPVGAVFQIWNLHPDSGAPVTISSLDEGTAAYRGNPAANAQALVAKAAANGEFEESHLDISRLNIPADVLDWVESAPGSETLADAGLSYYCNGDSMFHVNKGVIAFKMDAARDVRMTNTHVDGLVNHGAAGSTLCGDYLEGVSHPDASHPGYGGAATRGYTFAGSEGVLVNKSTVRNAASMFGSVVGYDVMTDSADVRIVNGWVYDFHAGSAGDMPYGSPTAPAEAIAYHVEAAASSIEITHGCATGLIGYHATYFVHDHSGAAVVVEPCRMS